MNGGSTMKKLKEKIKEDLYATPQNTMGMGQVSLPSVDGGTVGSDAIPTDNIPPHLNYVKPAKKKKLKHKKKGAPLL